MCHRKIGDFCSLALVQKSAYMQTTRTAQFSCAARVVFLVYTFLHSFSIGNSSPHAIAFDFTCLYELAQGAFYGA